MSEVPLYRETSIDIKESALKEAIFEQEERAGRGTSLLMKHLLLVGFNRPYRDTSLIRKCHRPTLRS